MSDIIKEFSHILNNIDTFVRVKVTSDMKNQIYIAGEDYDIKSYMIYFYAEKKGDCVKVYYTSPSFIGEFYFKDGLLHKEDSPAVDFKIKKSYSFSSLKWHQHQRWMLNGEIKSKNNLTIKSSTYSLENIVPDINYDFDPNHKKDYEIFQYTNKEGISHRLYAPAIISIKNDKVRCEWYINGEEYDEYDYKVILKCFQFVKKLKKNVVKKVLYNSKLVCKDIAGMISRYVY